MKHPSPESSSYQKADGRDHPFGMSHLFQKKVVIPKEGRAQPRHDMIPTQAIRDLFV